MTGYVELDAARWDLQVATGQTVAGTGVEARMREARAAAGRLAAGLPGLLDELEHLRRAARPTLADMQARYLEVRQHTLSTDGMPRDKQLLEEARYVEGEALELRGAIEEHLWSPRIAGSAQSLAHVRHELADVVIAATVLAGYLGVTVEACIAEKTEHDRGRG